MMDLDFGGIGIDMPESLSTESDFDDSCFANAAPKPTNHPAIKELGEKHPHCEKRMMCGRGDLSQSEKPPPSSVPF